jgi:hypothetical protein
LSLMGLRNAGVKRHMCHGGVGLCWNAARTIAKRIVAKLFTISSV